MTDAHSGLVGLLPDPAFRVHRSDSQPVSRVPVLTSAGLRPRNDLSADDLETPMKKKHCIATGLIAGAVVLVTILIVFGENQGGSNNIAAYIVIFGGAAASCSGMYGSKCERGCCLSSLFRRRKKPAGDFQSQFPTDDRTA